MFVREFHELPPVVERDVVVARTDVVADVSRQHGRVGLGQFRSRKSLQAEQLINRRGVDPREELAFRIGPTVLDGAVIGSDCIIGAGALFTGKMNAPDGSMILGSPAKVVRELTEKEKESILANAALYLEKSKEYRAHAAKQA